MDSCEFLLKRGAGRRRFSISAPRLSVRRISPGICAGHDVAVVLAAFGLIWFAYHSGLEFAGFIAGIAA